MNRRGRPPKKKTTPRPSNVPEPTNNETHSIESINSESNNSQTDWKKSRAFDTKNAVIVNIPKFGLVAEVPLYTQQRSLLNPDGQIPLEEWSQKELMFFRDELEGLLDSMQNTRAIIEGELAFLQSHMNSDQNSTLYAVPETQYCQMPGQTMELGRNGVVRSSLI